MTVGELEEALGERGAAPQTDRLAGLYSQHADRAARIAYLLTGDRHLSEDLVQEAFVRVCGRFANLRNADAFAGYLRRTVINLVRAHARRSKLERERGALAAMPERPSEMNAPPRDDVRRALLSLPVRQRAAVVLRYYADLSEEQTADTLRCSPSAVRSLVQRAMESLRHQIRDE